MNSQYPPIHLFDDVADEAEFEALFELQALTNPRLLNQAGDLNLLPAEEIPFGIPGCSYAVAPFVHVNPDGTRFGDGSFGVLYLGDSLDTAIKEVAYHQGRYFRGVHNLKFDRIVFRGLLCSFNGDSLLDGTVEPLGNPIYDPDDYSTSQALGRALRKRKEHGLQYHSVRAEGATCWGLFTPRHVQSVVQKKHYEFVWDGESISSINALSRLR